MSAQEQKPKYFEENKNHERLDELFEEMKYKINKSLEVVKNEMKKHIDE